MTSGDVISEKVAKNIESKRDPRKRQRILGEKTWKFQVGQHGKMFANTSSKSMVEPSSNSPKGVCAMCAENGSQMLEKMTKTAVLYVFYFHPDSWKNDPILTSIFFQLDWFNHLRETGFFVMEEKQTCFKAATMMP